MGHVRSPFVVDGWMPLKCVYGKNRRHFFFVGLPYEVKREGVCIRDVSSVTKNFFFSDFDQMRYMNALQKFV